MGYKFSIKKFIKYFILMMGFNGDNMLVFSLYPKYRKQLAEFKRMGGIVTHTYPIITDYNNQAGSVGGSYFHQDLLIANLIYKKSPTRHIDIGSRVDGFVAHVASFRRIDVIDIRELEDTGHENINFIRSDMMSQNYALENITDSVSCLHAIEHFGLGRYGDPIDPKGHIKGFNNILNMLKTNGLLYISFPIAKQNETHFNAHRVFHPMDIFSWPESKNKIELVRFDYIDDAGRLHMLADVTSQDIDVKFGFGIYTLKKIS